MDYTLDAEATLFILSGEEPVSTPPLAMAYVPMQQWVCVYEDDQKALHRGTIFPCLDKPFLEGMCPDVQ